MELDQRHRQILRHALTGSSGEDIVYRNYFAACEGNQDWSALIELVACGLMVVGRRVPGRSSRYFHCTHAGAMAVGLWLPLERRESQAPAFSNARRP